MEKQFATTELRDLDYLEGTIRVLGDEGKAAVFLVDKNGVYHLLRVNDLYN